MQISVNNAAAFTAFQSTKYPNAAIKATTSICSYPGI